MQCKALRDSAEEIQRYDVAYFMVSVDTLEDNTAFAEENNAELSNTWPIPKRTWWKPMAH